MQNTATQPLSILVIDDTLEILFATTRLLTSAGYAVLEAATGAEGLRLAQEQQPDIVLLDVLLPDIDGRDLCRQMKRDPRIRQSFIIIASHSKTSSDDQSEALELGADGYIARPISNRELLARLSAFVRIKRTEDALRDSETRFRAIFEASVDAIGVAKSGTHIYLNPPYLALFGYSDANALLGKSILSVYAADQHPMIRQYVDQRLRGEPTPTIYQSRGIRSDGAEFDMELHISTYTLNSELYTQVIVRDITERKQIELTQMFLLQSGWSSAGEDFFQATARYLAETVGVEYVCIDRLSGDLLSAQTVAVYHDNQFEENVAYSLYDTPCGEVVGKSICLFPREVRHLFPRDSVLQDMCAESYVGVTLWSADGRPIGLIALIGRQPLTNPALTELLLKLVAIRAAGELERRQAEEALQQSETQYRELVQTSHDLIWRVNAEGRITFMNDAARDILGYAPHEMIGRPFVDFLPAPRHTDNVEPLMTRLTKHAHLTDLENRLLHKNGEEKVLLDNLVIRRDAQGAVSDILGTSKDITKRRRAEEALQQSEERLGQTQAIGHIGSWVYDVSSDTVWASDEGFRIFGFPPATIRLPLADFEACMQDRDMVHQALMNLLSSGVPYNIEYTINPADGSPARIIAAVAEEINDETGSPVRVMGVLHDITERRRLDDQLNQAARMESIGRLAGGIAHDFNNILTGIIGITQIMQNKEVTKTGMQEDLAEVLALAERATNLTRQLLIFSRRQQFQPRIVPANLITENVSKLLTRVIGEDITLVITHQANVGSVKVDVAQMETVLINLAVNARDAMLAGGQFTIEMANTVVAAAQTLVPREVHPGEYVRITITDTGQGMEPAVLEHIFEPFYTTKGVGQGTGLGLATVYGIIDEHEGYIWVESEPERGTRFTILLPRVDNGEKKTETDQRIASLPRGHETILLVEDDDAVREVVFRILTEYGYLVHVAASPGEALDKYMSVDKTFALLLTDVIMPEVNGIELYQHFVAQHPALKVMFISGYSSETLPEGFLLDHSSVLLQKPFTVARLLHALRHILDGTPGKEGP